MARTLTYPRFGFAEHKRNVFRCIPELDTTDAEMLAPVFFANMGKSLKAGDLIEVLREDYGRFTVLLVRRSEHGSVVTSIVSDACFDEAAEIEEPEAEYRVEFSGAQTLYRVVRVSDGYVVKDGLQTEPAAKRWLTNHLKTL